MSELEQPDRPKVCRILSLDGGGAKGFYTLGVLREIEAMTGKRLHESFDIIFGTSTGSIIASLLALGNDVETIHQLYKKHVPSVMQAKSAKGKTAALEKLAVEVFQDAKFDAVKTNLGVVTTKWQIETPMIFKGNVAQAHGRVASFKPGFGCTIADGVIASCPAYPYFERKYVTTEAGHVFELVDGGYCANNPTLYAIADAVAAMKYLPEECRVVSVGCGTYPEPKPKMLMRLYKQFSISLHILEKTMGVNTNSMEQLRKILFKQVPTVRISDTFDKPEMATDMFEHNLDKLNFLRLRGAESFANHEADLKKLFEDVGV